LAYAKKQDFRFSTFQKQATFLCTFHLSEDSHSIIDEILSNIFLNAELIKIKRFFGPHR
jgi:hypothetical protein